MSVLGRLGKVVGALLFVAVGCGLVFVGFEAAAYEQTIADREVTTTGTVVETDLSRLPDGNWTYEFDYEYRFDQEEELLDQGLEELYPSTMAGERRYRNTEDGGKHDTRSEARSEMREAIDDGTVVVYVDPFYPGQGSLSDATTPVPEVLQYAGSAVLVLGLVGLGRMARRVSA